MMARLQSSFQTPAALGANAPVLFPCSASMIDPGPSGRLSMLKKILWFSVLFTVLFMIGVNSGDLTYLLNLGNTVYLSCIGVG
jgi:hypothetical protein